MSQLPASFPYSWWRDSFHNTYNNLYDQIKYGTPFPNKISRAVNLNEVQDKNASLSYEELKSIHYMHAYEGLKSMHYVQSWEGLKSQDFKPFFTSEERYSLVSEVESFYSSSEERYSLLSEEDSSVVEYRSHKLENVQILQEELEILKEENMKLRHENAVNVQHLKVLSEKINELQKGNKSEKCTILKNECDANKQMLLLKENVLKWYEENSKLCTRKDREAIGQLYHTLGTLVATNKRFDDFFEKIKREENLKRNNTLKISWWKKFFNARWWMRQFVGHVFELYFFGGG
ncbi:hypothetical protein SUGI_1003640 [Cryptomeria japonica]|nr:hypothetical protein SUGI_1003640 [Cryptomeria japonica]